MKAKNIIYLLITSALITGCTLNKNGYNEDSTQVLETTIPDESQGIAVNNDDLEEKYIEAVKTLYEDNIDLFGNQVENYHNKPEWNKFAIMDIDSDGALELIISWKDSSTAGEWGGVYQYDFDKQEYYSEQLMDPDIIFYENGTAYEPWRHNQGPGEMWPFDASLYNSSTDQYEHVFSADSWNKELRVEGFPDDVDTDGVGIVYYTDVNSEYIDYDNPISQTEFNGLYDTYFEDAIEIDVDYYELTEKGLAEYLNNKKR